MQESGVEETVSPPRLILWRVLSSCLKIFLIIDVRVFQVVQSIVSNLYTIKFHVAIIFHINFMYSVHVLYLIVL